MGLLWESVFIGVVLESESGMGFFLRELDCRGLFKTDSEVWELVVTALRAG